MMTENSRVSAPAGYANVYMFNSPQFFFGLLGHSGVVFEYPDGHVRLFSFHPVKNLGEPFDKGSFAHIVNPADATSFKAFEDACLRQHRNSRGKSIRGILLNNGTVTWYERIRRVLQFTVPLNNFEAMESYAELMANDPPRFNVIFFSCQHFVNDVLAQGGVLIRGKVLRHRHAIIPNYIYRVASSRTEGVIAFDRFALET